MYLFRWKLNEYVIVINNLGTKKSLEIVKHVSIFSKRNFRRKKLRFEERENKIINETKKKHAVEIWENWKKTFFENNSIIWIVSIIKV